MGDHHVITGGQNTLLVVSAVAAIVAVHYVTRKLLKEGREAEPVYPPLAPVGMGELIKEISSPGYPWFMLRMAKESKSFTFRLNLPIMGTPMVVAVGEYETQREILLHRQTERPMMFYNSFNNITGGIPSMFTSNGEYWHSRRKLLAPAFDKTHVKRMKDAALATMERWIETKIRPMAEKGEPFDVGKEILNVMLSSLCKTAFEYDLTEEESKDYMDDLNICFREFLFKSTTNPLRPLFGYLLPERRQAHQAAGRLMDFAQKIIDQYRTVTNPIKGTFMDRLVTSDVYRNEEERRAEIVFLLLAGHDTTGYTIVWTLMELARKPQYIQEIRQSLVSVPPEDWEKSEPLRNAIKESMRLYPVAAAGSFRVIGADVTTKQGFLLPKGSIAFLSLILLLRNPEVYNNPDEFLPERWQQADTAMNDSFLPFSLGKQNCVGQGLAKAELHSMIARICSEFDLTVVEDGEPEFFLTLKPVGAKLLARKAVE